MRCHLLIIWVFVLIRVTCRGVLNLKTLFKRDKTQDVVYFIRLNSKYLLKSTIYCE